MPIHALVLDAALRICGGRRGWTFRPVEIVEALAGLNAASVRTHVMSRCCVNAPPHHVHRWPYFRRVRRGIYEILPDLRKRRPQIPSDPNWRLRSPAGPGHDRTGNPSMRVEVRESGGRYVANSTALSRKIEGPKIESVISEILRMAERGHEMPGEPPGRLSIEIRLPARARPLPPDPVIAAYARDVDRTLIRENLRLGVEERLRKLQHWMSAMEAVRGVARRTGRKTREP
jgi:hypothetical protein